MAKQKKSHKDKTLKKDHKKTGKGKQLKLFPLPKKEIKSHGDDSPTFLNH